MTFYDSSSEYKNNSALFGGAISCSSCHLFLSGNLFSYNIAKEGGSIMAESVAYVYS